MLITSIALTLALIQSSTAIGGRPLSWDWFGVIPLDAAQAPSSEQQKEFEDMRKGDYFLAYIPARNHLRAHPSDVVDAWIMRECAKKRGTAEELLTESETLLMDHPTTATRLLHTYALNLEYKAKMRHNPTHNPLMLWSTKSRRRRRTCGPTRVRTSRRRPPCSLLSTATSCSPARRCLAFARIIPTRWKPRRSTSGRFFGESSASTSVMPTDPASSSRHPTKIGGPSCLPTNPGWMTPWSLIDYYRAMAYAMKAYFSDPKKDDEFALKQVAAKSGDRFLKTSTRYPVLTTCVRRYLSDTRGFGAFFPAPDE